jgi:hypothetical protein
MIVCHQKSTEKTSKARSRAYCMPVILMFTPKFVIPLMLGETVKVKVALIELPGFSVVPSRFQLNVTGPFAF